MRHPMKVEGVFVANWHCNQQMPRFVKECVMTGVPAESSRIRQGIPWNRSMRRVFWAIPLFLCGWLWCTPSGQQQIPNMTNQQRRQPLGGFGDEDAVFAARQIRALNADRQKSMVSD